LHAEDFDWPVFFCFFARRVQIDMSAQGLFGAGTSGGIKPGGLYYRPPALLPPSTTPLPYRANISADAMDLQAFVTDLHGYWTYSPGGAITSTTSPVTSGAGTLLLRGGSSNRWQQCRDSLQQASQGKGSMVEAARCSFALSHFHLVGTIFLAASLMLFWS